MSLTGFHIRFPELAFKEMRTILLQGQEDVPDGVFGFLELYCEDPNCDCRRVLIWVVSLDNPKDILATISYGWGTLEHYKKTMIGDPNPETTGVSLDPLNPQTQWSPGFLRLFEMNLKDPQYVERLKRHYAMVKESVKPKPSRGASPSRKRRKRR